MLGPSSSALGALTQPRSPGSAPDYQLDQAVAALALPLEGSTRGPSVQALFDLGHPTTGPFPSNWFTVFDDTQNTWRRVNLPYPDCSIYVSDCEDLAVLNELDGFNLQPRLSIPFSGPIDVNSVNYTNVFLVSLGSTVEGQGFMPRGYGVGINQVVWDVATNTLHVESDELLAQHTRFALYVTTGVRDAQGNPVGATEEFRTFRQTVQGDYREHLHDAMLMAGASGFREHDIAAASVFTTQSATAVMEKMRDQIKGQTPQPANFNLGPKGERTVFPFTNQSSVVWQQQTGDNPPSFTPATFGLAALRVIPGAVGWLAFGKYISPDFAAHPGEYIPSVPTRTGTPPVQGHNEVYFNLILPTGPKPAAGWPVAIYGHGSGGSKQFFGISAVMAAQGIATLQIDVVGHGFGPLGTVTVREAGTDLVTFPSGGRGFDRDRNGVIGAREGEAAAAPRTILQERDALRQTAADLLQLVRVVEVGMDVDGDGFRDLDPSRVFYFGQSWGGMYGTVFLATEPNVSSGVPVVPAGSFVLNRRLWGSFRASLGAQLAARTPSLIDSPGVVLLDGIPIGSPHYHENLPLRSGAAMTLRLADDSTQVLQSPVANVISGAMAIQQWLESREWATISGDALAFVPHLRRAPLPGVPAKSVIYQFAKGDQTANNPQTTALLRAGGLADRATYYRNDLAYAEDPRVPRNPHGFMNSSITSTIPLVAAITRGAQTQIATFFASGGKTVIHPEPARFFEVPIQGPLPEELNYIP